MVGSMIRSKVGYGCTKDSGIRIHECFLGCFVHFLRTFHIHPTDIRMMRLQGYRTAYQNHFRTSGCTLFGQGIAHFARRIIADETYRVNLLISRTGSDDHLLSIQVLLLCKESLQHFHNLFRFFHASFAYQMAGQFAFARFDDMVAVRTEDIQVLLSRRMSEHIQVHGWSHKYRSLHGQVSGNEHIVCHTMCHLADGAGCSRSNDHGICP